MGDVVISEEKYNQLLSELNSLRIQVNGNDSKDDEILLSEEEQRYVIFPIKYDKVWEMYKKAEANFWTAEELDLSKDLKDFNPKMNDNEERVPKQPLEIETSTTKYCANIRSFKLFN